MSLPPPTRPSSRSTRDTRSYPSSSTASPLAMPVQEVESCNKTPTMTAATAPAQPVAESPTCTSPMQREGWFGTCTTTPSATTAAAATATAPFATSFSKGMGSGASGGNRHHRGRGSSPVSPPVTSQPPLRQSPHHPRGTSTSSLMGHHRVHDVRRAPRSFGDDGDDSVVASHHTKSPSPTAPTRDTPRTSTHHPGKTRPHRGSISHSANTPSQGRYGNSNPYPQSYRAHHTDSGGTLLPSTGCITPATTTTTTTTTARSPATTKTVAANALLSGNSPDEQRRRKQREKQVSFGFVTEGYRNMIRLVDHDPVLRGGGILPLAPPDITRGSKRTWDIQLRKWRRALHMFDYVFIDGVDDEATRADVEAMQRSQWVSAAFTRTLEAEGDDGTKPASTGNASSNEERKVVISERLRVPVATLLAVRSSPRVPTKIPVEDDLACILRSESCFEPVRNVVPQTASSLTKGTDICPLEAGIKIHIAPSAAVLQKQREQQQQQQQALLLQRQQQQQQVQQDMAVAALSPYRHPAKVPSGAAGLVAGGTPSPSPTTPFFPTPLGTGSRGRGGASAAATEPSVAVRLDFGADSAVPAHSLTPARATAATYAIPPPLPLFAYPATTGSNANSAMNPATAAMPEPLFHTRVTPTTSPEAAAAAAAAMMSVMCSPLYPYYLNMNLGSPAHPTFMGVPQQQRQQQPLPSPTAATCFPHSIPFLGPQQAQQPFALYPAANTTTTMPPSSPYTATAASASVSPSHATRAATFDNRRSNPPSSGRIPGNASKPRPTLASRALSQSQSQSQQQSPKATPGTVPRFVTRLPQPATETRFGEQLIASPHPHTSGRTAAAAVPSAEKRVTDGLEGSGENIVEGSPPRRLFDSHTDEEMPGTDRKRLTPATGKRGLAEEAQAEELTPSPSSTTKTGMAAITTVEGENVPS